MKTIRLKIIYEGNGPGYKGKVVDAETGEIVEGVVSVHIHAEGRKPYAYIKVIAPDIDVTVDGIEVNR